MTNQTLRTIISSWNTIANQFKPTAKAIKKRQKRSYSFLNASEDAEPDSFEFRQAKMRKKVEEAVPIVREGICSYRKSLTHIVFHWYHQVLHIQFLYSDSDPVSNFECSDRIIFSTLK